MCARYIISNAMIEILVLDGKTHLFFFCSAVKPVIEFSEVKRNSAVVTVSDPPLFLRPRDFRANGLSHPKSVRVRRTSVGENIVLFTNHTLWPPDGDGPPGEKPTTHEIKLSGNIPGTQYQVKCEMECDSGEILVNEAQFSAKDPRCMYKYS